MNFDLLTIEQLDELITTTDRWTLHTQLTYSRRHGPPPVLFQFNYWSEIATKRFYLSVHLSEHHIVLEVHGLVGNVPRNAIRHALGFPFRHYQDAEDIYKTRIKLVPNHKERVLQVYRVTVKVLHAIAPIKVKK